MTKSSLLFLGIKGTVLALDRATGQEVWRTVLKGDFVTVAVEDGELYAAAQGAVYCLDPSTGQIRWKNPLTGFGWGLISIASAGPGQTVLTGEYQRQEEAATS
jgi:outer membrane protein assembly factor BamB